MSIIKYILSDKKKDKKKTPDTRTKIKKVGDAINKLNAKPETLFKTVPEVVYDTLIGQHVNSIKKTRAAIQSKREGSKRRGHSDLRKRGLFYKGKDK